MSLLNKTLFFFFYLQLATAVKLVWSPVLEDQVLLSARVNLVMQVYGAKNVLLETLELEKNALFVRVPTLLRQLNAKWVRPKLVPVG